MRAVVLRFCATAIVVTGLLMFGAESAVADCGLRRCPTASLEHGSATLELTGEQSAQVVGAGSVEVIDYAYRLRPQCVVAAEVTGNCSPASVRTCPQELGRVIEYFFVERRPVVRADGTAVVPVLTGQLPGDLIDDWSILREGCFDITPLNPPPSPAEVFSYFQRLPLPQLATQHQPPGDGLAGLPVIFYTDSPSTQTFTVDIRGFTVVIEATAEQFTWHTGDATGQIVTTDPGAPYPDETIEHLYRSGTYTARLTVTWGATFTIDGSAPVEVPGTTTTDGPPVTFDVLQARTVLTNPYD